MGVPQYLCAVCLGALLQFFFFRLGMVLQDYAQSMGHTDAMCGEVGMSSVACDLRPTQVLSWRVKSESLAVNYTSLVVLPPGWEEGWQWCEIVKRSCCSTHTGSEVGHHVVGCGGIFVNTLSASFLVGLLVDFQWPVCNLERWSLRHRVVLVWVWSGPSLSV